MPPEGASPMVWRSALFLVAATVRLWLFVWRELKADAELRDYNYSDVVPTQQTATRKPQTMSDRLVAATENKPGYR
jgi:hypothetical protein